MNWLCSGKLGNTMLKIALKSVPQLWVTLPGKSTGKSLLQGAAKVPMSIYTTVGELPNMTDHGEMECAIQWHESSSLNVLDLFGS